MATNHGPHSMKWGARSNNPIPNDFYETPSIATEALLKIITPSGSVLEPCNGRGAISSLFKVPCLTMDIDPNMLADIYSDFMRHDFKERFDYIITNPPFNLNTSGEWAQRCISLLKEGGTCALFLKLLFVEGNKRREFFRKFPPYQIYVFSKRITINDGCGICYAWFIWKKDYQGSTQLLWI